MYDIMYDQMYEMLKDQNVKYQSVIAKNDSQKKNGSEISGIPPKKRIWWSLSREGTDGGLQQFFLMVFLE